ncbi:YbfB/YjiJ family MFS transporter [Nocardia sp. AG03]|uniref:YbfB/YjiJ family MFS transporter n=1 Tax=Nocardia sp. AG03 TaxID=3025312 RepID=UPI002418BA91|nr:YbfB/YjiJ family MFS transporter [Nocardia sp. AG03]
MISRHFRLAGNARSVTGVTLTAAAPPTTRPRLDGPRVAVAAAAGMAAAMGVGRFVFTPLLPIMSAATGLSAGDGALIATGNYAGYLVGAVLLTRRPHWNRRATFLAWSVVLIVSEALMAVSAQVAAQTALRFAAGVASAAIFVACAATVAHHRREGASIGVAFAGVGVGIAVTGVFTVLAGNWLSWQALWVGSAVLTAVLLAPAWLLDIRDEGHAAAVAPTPRNPDLRRAWRLLLSAYFAEGLGYIVLGTFLVAAVADDTGGDSVTAAWLWALVGVSAVPATVLWHAVARRIGTGRALVAALVVQSAGTLAPVLSDSLLAAVAAAVTFGATFMAVVMLAVEAGSQLGIPRSAATLTAVFAVGQVLGPLLVLPVIGDSYAVAFGIAAGVVAVSALLAAAATGAMRSALARPAVVGADLK